MAGPPGSTGAGANEVVVVVVASHILALVMDDLLQ